jgi:hypothetical protein
MDASVWSADDRCLLRTGVFKGMSPSGTPAAIAALMSEAAERALPGVVKRAPLSVSAVWIL